VVRLAFAALMCNGHLLFEDLPGTGKTTLAIAIARVIGCDYNRIQFTNDLMPSDILGTEILVSSKEEFRFRKGPVFTNVLLADEINRATPRAQSALLEAMGEGRVSVSGKTIQLPRPFLVLATQNPMDLYGTFPLPESQLDRFFMRLAIGYPEETDEARIIMNDGHYEKAKKLPRLMSPEQVISIQESVRLVKIKEKIVSYILDIARFSRKGKAFKYGLSTRCLIALKKGAQAWAFMEGRDYVTPDDVKAVFPSVTYHRLTPAGDIPEQDRIAFLGNFLEKIRVPL
jgi:MoxR-like ATPase